MRHVGPHRRPRDQLSPGKEFRSQDRWLALAAVAVVTVMLVALMLQVDIASPAAKSVLITFLALGLATAMIAIVGWAIASIRFGKTEVGRAAADEVAATAPVRNRWHMPSQSGPASPPRVWVCWPHRPTPPRCWRFRVGTGTWRRASTAVASRRAASPTTHSATP